MRRSRRRFWKSEHDADKATAYATLYHVLLKMAKLLAPFTPFVSEVMYQNLVCSVREEAYASVHHCAWPEADAAAIDEDLMAQMALARSVASLGLGARSSANIKVRQPLARALVYAGDQHSDLSEELRAIILDELNVKEVQLVDREDALVTYRLVADGRVLGPKFGRQFPKVRAALAAADAGQVARSLRAGQNVSLSVDGEAVEISQEEVLIETAPAEGLAVASEKGITVGIDAVITPALRDEGLVRDLVRYVQTLRRDVDYQLDQRITVGLFGLGAEARGALAAFQDYLMAETLATAVLTDDDGAAWDGRSEEKLAGEAVVVAVRA